MDSGLKYLRGETLHLTTGMDLGIPALDAIAQPAPVWRRCIGATCIAFSGIFYRYAEVSPSTGTVYRAVFGLPLLLLVAWAERRRYGPLPGRARRFAAIAGVFFAGDLMFWHHAIEAVGAGLATVLGNLQVIIVGVVAWLLFGERPSRATLLALPVVLVGVVLISGVVGAGAYGANPPLGVVLGRRDGALLRRLPADHPGGRRDPRRPAGPVAIATIFVVLASAWCGRLVIGDLDLAPPLASLGWLAVLGVTSQSIGYLCISLALPRLPAVVTSIILLAQPVLTVGLSVVLLSERPSPAQLLGVVFVVGGIALATVPLARLRDAVRRRRDDTVTAGE